VEEKFEKERNMSLKGRVSDQAGIIKYDQGDFE